MIYRALFLVVALGWVGSNVFAAPEASEKLRIHLPVEKFKLANGLTVLLHQDRTVPAISYHTWYRVGSKDEKPGVTGAAHMLEHMMFKGAKKYTGKQFDHIHQANGIVNNAFTTWDYTGFYEKLPSNKLELIMDMEVDRMQFLALNAEDLKSELEVVKEERRWRIDNNPPSLLRERLFANVFKDHPYGWPVIGTMADITAYTPEKLRHFYETYYVPNNAILVIAGDFDVASTRRLVEKYYGRLKTRKMAERKFPPPSEIRAAQRFVVESDVQNSTVVLAYPGVSAGHPDSFALDLLASLVADGPSSRLYKKLVYKSQTATMTGGGNITNMDAGLLVFMAAMKPGKASGPAESILRRETQALREKLVSEKELRKAKNQLFKDYISELDTIDGKARALAVNEILFGSYERLFTDLEQYEKVTPADIQRVANAYLIPNREVLGILQPKKRGGLQ